MPESVARGESITALQPTSPSSLRSSDAAAELSRYTALETRETSCNVRSRHPPGYHCLPELP